MSSLQASQALTVNVTLELGELEETILVAGNAVQVDITTATISEVVDHARIVELPLNGRDAARLTTLVAGTIIGSISTESGKSIPGGLRLSTNGSEEKDVSFRLDGTSNNDPYFQENQTFPFPEALQEFSIQTSNYSAASGNQAGAVVNAVTRSGTNSFHGGTFGYVRDMTFNATPFFGSRDQLKRKQYGGYVGGPVKLPGYNGMNRTFFFTGWQGTLIDNVGLDRERQPPHRRHAARRLLDLRTGVQRNHPRSADGAAVSEQTDSGQPLRSGHRQHAEATPQRAG